MVASMTRAQEIVARAMEHHRHGRIAQAEDGYRETLRLDPKNAEALHLLGTIVAGQGKVEQGIELISRSLSLNPNAKEAHFNLGNILARIPRMAEAERHFREAYRRDRPNADTANGLGGALLHLGRYGDAEPYLREALACAPASAPVLLNMGMLMDATGRFDDAIRFYDQVLAQHPGHAPTHAHRALALLLRGQFHEGWTEYAWQLKSIPTLFGRFPFPYWRGEPLGGRKILVWTEQGPGDEILVATMIPDLVAAGAEIVLLCSPRMAPLFARSFPMVRVVPAGQNQDDASITTDIAFQASAGELGAALRRDFSAFPARRALLHGNLNRTANLRRRYQAAAPGTKLVGISWRSKNFRLEEAKTIPLAGWASILRQSNLTFVSLQYGDTKDEIARVQHDLGVSILVDDEVDSLSDLDDFAAQVAAMDLVISVSNTTVHVAGALGIPVWALVPSNHGRMWYWFLERSDSPWYPSARLFRQDAKTGWQTTVTAVAEKLAEIARPHNATDIPAT